MPEEEPDDGVESAVRPAPRRLGRTARTAGEVAATQLRLSRWAMKVKHLGLLTALALRALLILHLSCGVRALPPVIKIGKYFNFYNYFYDCQEWKKKYQRKGWIKALSAKHYWSCKNHSIIQCMYSHKSSPRWLDSESLEKTDVGGEVVSR